MDTHVACSPELADYQSEPIARLPGEPNLVEGSSGPVVPPASDPPPAQPTAPVRRRRRSSLLGGIAVSVLCAGVAGAFMLSPYNHIIPISPGMRSQVRQIAAEPGAALGQLLAPSAQLAGVPPATRPDGVVEPAEPPKPREERLRELLALQPGAVPPTQSPPAAASPPPRPTKPATATATTGASVDAPVVQEPGAASPQPALTPATASAPAPAPIAAPAPSTRPNITDAVTAAALTGLAPFSASPPPTAGQAVNEPRPPSATASAGPELPPAEPALAQLARVQAAPMSDQQQVQVLQAVTEVATLVKDLKAQNTALRADYGKQLADTRARLADFERRLNLAEARAAIRSAAAEPSPPPDEAPPPLVRPIAARVPVPGTHIEPVASTPKRYRVRAASPGLAMLAAEGRGGGDGAQIQVSVGDTIPGWGVVKSVVQKGASWVVNTEHGVVE